MPHSRLFSKRPRGLLFRSQPRTQRNRGPAERSARFSAAAAATATASLIISGYSAHLTSRHFDTKRTDEFWDGWRDSLNIVKEPSSCDPCNASEPRLIRLDANETSIIPWVCPPTHHHSARLSAAEKYFRDLYLHGYRTIDIGHFRTPWLALTAKEFEIEGFDRVRIHASDMRCADLSKVEYNGKPTTDRGLPVYFRSSDMAGVRLSDSLWAATQNHPEAWSRSRCPDGTWAHDRGCKKPDDSTLEKVLLSDTCNAYLAPGSHKQTPWHFEPAFQDCGGAAMP